MLRIVLEGVEVDFGTGLPGEMSALSGVDLEIREGECLAVIGPTGAGKTTLLEVASGLLAPTRGLARVDGMPSGDDERRLRSVAGLVYQFPELQFFEESVFDDVAFGPLRQGLGPDEVRSRVRRALESAGLDPDAFSSRSPTALSAGEKRRAAIAGILALDRPFLLLDEPTAGLDPGSREGIVDLIRRESGSKGVVVVSHDLRLVDTAASRTVVMIGGAVVFGGATGDVLSDVGALTEAGLTPPEEYILLSRVRERAPSEAPTVRKALFDGRLADAGPG